MIFSSAICEENSAPCEPLRVLYMRIRPVESLESWLLLQSKYVFTTEAVLYEQS